MSELWTTKPDVCLDTKLRMSETGAGSLKPVTVIDVFKNTCNKHGSSGALYQKKKDASGKLDDEWTCWTYSEYLADCNKFAQALIHLNVDVFKIINIIGFNSPEWLIANTGAIMAGCIAAGIYTTNLPEACQYISDHSEAEVIVLEDNKQLEKYAKIGKSLKKMKAVVVWGEPINKAFADQVGKPVYSWKDFLMLGSPSDKLAERQAQIKPGNCCTLIYTSGTTGPPKAVMISHDNVTWTTRLMVEHLGLNHEERVLSYLPLSHIAAQLLDIHAPLSLGCKVYFAQPDALKGSLTNSLKDMEPTFFFGVPRVWEKIQEKMAAMGRETVGLKKTLSTWAKSKGTEKNKRAQFGAGGGAPCGYGLAKTIVLSKIRNALGLGKCRSCFTGAAPISDDCINYFASLDIPIYEIFGQSECTGPHTMSMAGEWKVGSCGRPIDGSQTMIAPGTKELCYKGRHIFMGYMYMEEKTRETIDEQGYLHSGDVAEFDENNKKDVPAPSGFMHITGRIKELIITAGGENIPPVLIEDAMKSEMLALSNCMVIGDKQKYLTMLITVKCVMDLETSESTEDLAPDALFVGKELGSTATTITELVADPLWTAYFEKGMKAANTKSESRAQIVQKYKILTSDFSEKAGDLTPTLKLKRSVVVEKNQEHIKALYA